MGSVSQDSATSNDVAEQGGYSSSSLESSEIEASKVGIMRALVEKEDFSAKAQKWKMSSTIPLNLKIGPMNIIPQFKEITVANSLFFRRLNSIGYPTEIDDYMIRRFLRARDLDIEKGSNLLLKYLSWRREFVPNGVISTSEILNELSHNKLFMQGVDKMGRPVVVGFGGRHRPSKGSMDEFKRFIVFSLDKITARMPAGQEKFLCIGDLSGWGYTSSDVRGYLAALSILQDCYPERLGKLFVVHVPYIFMAAWKAVYPFIDKKTKKKIVFVEDKKLRSTLLADIDESQLPEAYGGKLPLVPIQDS